LGAGEAQVEVDESSHQELLAARGCAAAFILFFLFSLLCSRLCLIID
jgi:hypothetical protein